MRPRPGGPLTLLTAQRELRQKLDEGVNCPCCGQLAKVYKRTIYATMARDLIKCYRVAGHDWFHVPTVVGYNGGDLLKVRYWGLMEEAQEKRDDGGRAGWWRITGNGGAYVTNQGKVRKYARVYNGDCLGFAGDYVGITDALGTKFDFQELMTS